MFLRLALALALSFSLTTSILADWPQFRGPSGQGIAPKAMIPLRWSETENVAWSTEVPGKGWSSPIVREDQIWLTTAVETEPTPEQIEAQFEASQLDRDKFGRRQVAGSVALKVICLDRETGQILKEMPFAEVKSPEAIHVGNTYASPTPIIEGDRLYVHFGINGTACIDTNSGDVLWKKVVPVFYSVGAGSSPVIFEDLLILVCDGIDKQFVIALDKHTGETVWRTERPPFRSDNPQHQKAYSTPLLVPRGDETQMIVPGAQWVVSYNPRTGSEYWRVDHGSGFSNVPRPVYGHGMVYVCTGYGTPQLWAIRVDGSGDVTETHVQWKVKRSIPKNPSPVLVDDLIFLTSDNGVASCFNALDGKTNWVKRLGGNYSASPIVASDRVYFFSHEGEITVVRASAKYAELATSQIDGQLMASPAVLPSSLILRSDTKVYCIE